jgi:Fic family protein
VIATSVPDLLCIHPFRDGNGCVSRRTATLLLESGGFQVAREVSLERLVEESKEQYYRVPAECSEGWHEGRNPVVPWWNYFLDMLRRAYDELELQIGSIEARPAKNDFLRRAILAQVEQLTLGDLAAPKT